MNKNDSSNDWRKLAYQFDAQRMAAMAHLNTLLTFPTTHAEAARSFLAATPKEQIASVRSEPVAWQARKLKDGKEWGPPGTNKKAFDQLADEGYEIRCLRA